MIRKNLYRILGIAISTALLVGSIGCQATTSQNSSLETAIAESSDTANTDTAESTEAEAETEIAEPAPVVEEVSFLDDGYAYDAEDNIIDDNYRNYYEIFVRSYYDSDGDGLGDLDGVTEKLNYIAGMGFNGIWLMPIMQSPSYHKYDVVDYYSIDSEYGTTEDFKELIAAAHERGIRVIIDMVMNHSSSENPWFTEACDYLRTLGPEEEPDASVCPYVDYYHFSRTKQSAYYVVTGTDDGWWYEAQFDYGMPDLNLESEAVREEFEKIASYWIDLGVDGFRMDAAMHYDDSDINFNCDTLNWLYSYCTSLNPDFYMVSEVWSDQATIANYYKSETPSMFDFALSGVEGPLIKTARGTTKITKFLERVINNDASYSEENPDYIDAPFLTNHDMTRVANTLLSNETNLKMAAGLLLTLGGSPFVYYGEEIGMKSDGSEDPNKRLPMVWSKTDLTGITDVPTGAEEGVEMTLPGLDEQLQDTNSLLYYYRRALQIRNENPEIARGEMTLVESLCDGNQAAVTKTWNDSVIGIIYNNNDEAITVDLAGTELADMSICGYLSSDGTEITQDGTLVSLPARSICFVK